MVGDLIRLGDWVDYQGEKYFLTKIGDHGEYIIVKEGKLEVVSVKDLKLWRDKPEEES